MNLSRVLEMIEISPVIREDIVKINEFGETADRVDEDEFYKLVEDVGRKLEAPFISTREGQDQFLDILYSDDVEFALGKKDITKERSEDSTLTGSCWFCKSQTAEQRWAAKIRLYKITEYTTFSGVTTAEQTIEPEIPCCRICNQAHTKTTSLGTILIPLCGITGIIFALIFSIVIFETPEFFLVAIAVGTFFGVTMGYLIESFLSPFKIKPIKHAKKHPHIDKLIKTEGWKFGFSFLHILRSARTIFLVLGVLFIALIVAVKIWG